MRGYPHPFEDGGGAAALRKRVERLKELIDECGRETAGGLRTSARKIVMAVSKEVLVIY